MNGSSFNVANEDFQNDSMILPNNQPYVLGCQGWKTINHPLFQVANAFLFIGLMSPQVKHGILALHGSFVFGFLLLTVWSWVILCAPDFFSWNFAFMIINIIQSLMLIYHLKPIKFDETLERLYATVFEPMNVSRHLFKVLTDKNFCIMSTLYEGDAYALQGITKTDRLGLLTQGVMKVYSGQNLLHLIQECEFIDSPEFESSVTGDEKFQVSVYAGSTCSYIYWPRSSLEYLLLKEPYLATVINTIMGRDITNKLYALNNRAKPTSAGDHTPISQTSGCRSGDLRRTLAQLSKPAALTSPTGRAIPGLGTYDNACVTEEPEEHSSEGNYSATEEEVSLLTCEQKLVNQSKETASLSSQNSNQSGIHFCTNKMATKMAANTPQVHFQLQETG